MALVVTLLMLAAPLAVPVALASDPECVPGTFAGACSFSGDTLGGVYVYDSITIPAGVTVRATLPLTLHARQEVRVEGSIVETPSVTLTSDLLATITGTVRAADGTSLAPNGGDVQVIASTLNLHGTLQSGNGAPGLDMIQDLQDAATAVTSTGTPGGKGGDIVVGGASVVLDGVFIVGNGGKGGAATARGGTMAATAIGGAGGASGNVVLPAGVTPFTLDGAGRLFGGVGGDGGDAVAEPWQLISMPTDGDPGSSVTNDQRQVKPCAGSNTASPPGAIGGTGCEGAAATAEGGPGGYGLRQGGRGGHAEARGGPGGPGGRGADASRSHCAFTSTWQPPCPAFYGGQGGWGGTGGRGTATGGDGGNGLIYGGVGGNAWAYGGKGGTGGKGGLNGGGWIIGWDGKTSDAIWEAIGCLASIYDRSGTSKWVVCSRFVYNFTFWYVCGDSGRPGVGGWGGSAMATAGDGGKNVQGLGISADRGYSGGDNGDYGDPGTQGDKTPVPVGVIGGGGIPVVIYACA